MQPGLNYKEDDEKFILLGRVFQYIETNESKNILSRAGFRQRSTAIICIKIFFMSLFFNYNISDVIIELKNKEELRNFAGISFVPTEYQVSEYFSRFDAINYFEMINAYFRSYFKPHITKCDEYIVDATPVACDINVIKQYVKDKKLEKLGLKWGYSTTKKYFVGFKVSLVLEKTTLTPISIFIHPGAPSDARIFEGILKELKRRELIKKGDKIYFDKGYFSFENYQIGINKYKIIPIIFPKSNLDISTLKGKLSFPLEIYNDKNHFEKSKEEIIDLVTELVEILKIGSSI